MIARVTSIVGAALLLAAPWVLTPYEIGLATTGLAFAMLAVSVHLHTHVAGLPTLGQAAPFGVGAYAAALLARQTSASVTQLAVAALAGLGFAALTGLAVARTRGIVTIMVTLAIAEIAHATAISWTSVTGGSDGMALPRLTVLSGLSSLDRPADVYLWFLAVFALTIAVVFAVTRSPFGRSIAGIGDNPARMIANGYPVTAMLWATHTLTGALAGLGGAMLASTHRYVSPADLGLTISALALVAVVIGGSSLTGVVVGAFLVVALRDYLGGQFSGSWAGHGTLLLGAGFVACVYLLPAGLTGLVRRMGSHA
jgi:branched-chain amino acid transport system permease protein